MHAQPENLFCAEWLGLLCCILPAQGDRAYAQNIGWDLQQQLRRRIGDITGSLATFFVVSWSARGSLDWGPITLTLTLTDIDTMILALTLTLTSVSRYVWLTLLLSDLVVSFRFVSFR